MQWTTGGILGQNGDWRHQEFAMSDAPNTPFSATRPPGLSRVAGEFDDFDRLAEASVGWGLDWIQLDRGRFEARFEQIMTSSILASRFRFGRRFHQRGTVPAGMRTFGVIAPTSPPVYWRGIEGRQHHVIVFPTDEVFEFISLPGFAGDTFSLSEDRLSRVAGRLGLADPLERLPDHQAVYESDPVAVVRFRRRLDHLHELAEASAGAVIDDAVIIDAEFSAIAALVEVLNARNSDIEACPDITTRSRAFLRAVRYIEDHVSRSPSIEEICRKSGVSWRTLNYAFRERFDLTPKQYFKAVQLRRVRCDLVTGDPGATIAEIAARWGIWHMGQFARDYRRHFGELPSETRKRS